MIEVDPLVEFAAPVAAQGVSSERRRRIPAAFWVFVAYSFVLLGGTSFIAARRHLWYDEIVTFYIAQLPSLGSIWRALLTCVDAQPPLGYFFVHFAQHLWGTSELVTRLQSVLAFWLTASILYVAVARRTAAIYGLLAALIPSLTGVFSYAFEARPYALILLWTSLSFLLWQQTKEARGRHLAIVALMAVMILAEFTHYYAFLVAFPLLVGEAILAFRKRRIDWPASLAISAVILPIPVLLPHIRALRAFSATHGSILGVPALNDIYEFLLPKGLEYIAVLAVLVGVYLATRRGWEVRPTIGWAGIPHQEMAAAGAYLALPILCLLLANQTKALHFRYVIPAIFGLAILGPFLLYSLRLQSWVVRVLACCLLLNVLHIIYIRVNAPDEDYWGSVYEYGDYLSSGGKGLADSTGPVVVGVGPYAVISRYGSPELKDRSIHLIPKDHARDENEMVVSALRRIMPQPVRIMDYEEFARQHPSFTVYAPDVWFIDWLVEHGRDVRVERKLGLQPVYRVVGR